MDNLKPVKLVGRVLQGLHLLVTAGILITILFIPLTLIKKSPRYLNVPVSFSLKNTLSQKQHSGSQFRHVSLDTGKGIMKIIVNNRAIISLSMLFTAGYLLLLRVLLKQMILLYQSLSSVTFFSRRNMRRIRIAGLILFAIELFRLSKYFLFYGYILKNVELSTTEYSIFYDFRLTCTVFSFALLILLISEIFKNGIALQEEIDDVV